MCSTSLFACELNAETNLSLVGASPHILLLALKLISEYWRPLLLGIVGDPWCDQSRPDYYGMDSNVAGLSDKHSFCELQHGTTKIGLKISNTVYAKLLHLPTLCNLKIVTSDNFWLFLGGRRKSVILNICCVLVSERWSHLENKTGRRLYRKIFVSWATIIFLTNDGKILRQSIMSNGFKNSAYSCCKSRFGLSSEWSQCLALPPGSSAHDDLKNMTWQQSFPDV